MNEKQFAFLFTQLMKHLIVILLQKDVVNNPFAYNNSLQFLLYNLNRQPLISSHITQNKKTIPASFNVCKKLINELFENLTHHESLDYISRNLLIIQIKDNFKHKVIVNTSFLKIDPFESIVKKECQYSIVIGLQLRSDATIYDLRQHLDKKYDFETRRIVFYHNTSFKSYGNNCFIRDIQSFHNGSRKNNIIEIRAFELPNPIYKLNEIGINSGPSSQNLPLVSVVVVNWKPGLRSDEQRKAPVIFNSNIGSSYKALQLMFTYYIQPQLVEELRNESLSDLFSLELQSTSSPFMDTIPLPNMRSLDNDVVKAAMVNHANGSPPHLILIARWNTPQKIFNDEIDSKKFFEQSVLQILQENEPKVTSLQQHLHIFKISEIAKKHPNCSICQSRKPTPNSNFGFLPNIISFHIKKFKSVHRSQKNLSFYVDYPVLGLDMNPYIFKGKKDIQNAHNSEDFLYDLFAVVNNIESANAFEMYALNLHEKKWYHHTEGEAIALPEAQFDKKNASVLFYMRRNASVLTGLSEIFQETESTEEEEEEEDLYHMKSSDDSMESFLGSSSQAHVPSLSSNYYYVKEAKRVRIIPKVPTTNSRTSFTTKPSTDEEPGPSTSGVSLLPKVLGRPNPLHKRYKRVLVSPSSRGEQFVKDIHLRDSLIRDFQIRSISR